MTREQVIEQLTPIVREMLKDDTLVLRDDMSAENVPTWTSLSFMMLLTEIENRFGFKFKMMEILNLQNMGAIIDAVCSHTHTYIHTYIHTWRRVMNELKLYTVKDLQDWLKHNLPAKGLSAKIISPTKAWAIVNNPYVKDKDAVVAAIFDNGHLAAYVSAFPEVINETRYWWFSALYCLPQYRGKGYGLIVIGSLAEVYGVDYCLDRWAAPETIEIFSHLGHKTTYYPRYVLSDKHIDTSSVKGTLAYVMQKVGKMLHTKHPSFQGESYTLKYLPFIDEQSYAFMQTHRRKDIFFHARDFLNWVVQYPFTLSTPLMNRVETDNPFSSNVPHSQYVVVQVLVHETIVGVYILHEGFRALTVTYLYYDAPAQDVVFASILEHAYSMKVTIFRTENKTLAEYINTHLYFPKRVEEAISFSYPLYFADHSVQDISTGTYQLGDGDSFA